MPLPFRFPRLFFGLSFVLVLYLFYKILEPFLIAVILGITLVSLFYPNYSELNRMLRQRSNLSALVMCAIVTILIIVPLVLLSLALFREFNAAYLSFRQAVEQGEFGRNLPGQESAVLNEFWRHLGRYLGIQRVDLASTVSSVVDRIAQYLLEHYSMILGGIGSFFLNFFVMIFTMFFFFRDGDRFVLEIKKLVPLAPEYEDMVLAKLRDVTYATFFGIFATGICQGVLAGLTFFFLGINNPILWGTATAFFSLVPIFGTAIIWVPMAIYLILGGAVWKGIILVLLGSFIIGLADNVVRPLIIEGRTKGMHLLLVFFALAGGLVLFGLSGLVLGPLIVSLLITFLEIYKIEFSEELS
ncbi:MAG: AI-2E family transporter [Acidobacteria bacterium]|nr:AI-2E family transporter [Acidobacteriota bacterium]